MTEDDTSTLTRIVQERYRDFGGTFSTTKPRRPTKQCEYEGCDQWAWARGYCGSHYHKMKNAGLLDVIRPNVGDPVARFHASYAANPETGCWEWTGWIHPKGYGVLPIRGKKVRAHRFSWELHFGRIPEGILVLHECDNRKCCNPSHLFLGDHEANSQDCVAKGRHPRLGCDPSRKLTDAQAMNIRIMHARGLHLGLKNPNSMQKLADLFGLDQKTVSEMLKGGTYQKAKRNAGTVP